MKTLIPILAALTCLAFATPPPHHTPTPTPKPTVTPTPTPSPTPSPYPTPTPTVTPTPTATATPSATPSPTPTATVAQVLRPHGIMALNDLGWTNPAANGVRLRLDWKSLEKSKGVYTWGPVDDGMAKAKANNKQMGLSVSMWTVAPPDLGAKMYTLPPTGSGNVWKIFLPWDNSTVQSRVTDFYSALCAHVDGKVHYLAMGGLGDNIESYITPDPADIGLSMADGIKRWSDWCNLATAIHAANLKSTPFIVTAAKPFEGSDGLTALATFVRNNAAKYPGRFGVMNASLSAHSDTNYMPHQLVKELTGQNPTGLQFATSSTGFGGHDLGGTVQEALDSAIALGAHFVEVYPVDMNEPGNAQMFKDAATKLAK